jgi:ATP-dependent RNA helicase DeaD
MDGLEKGSLIDLIVDFGEVDKKVIGKIDLKGAYSFFELEKGVFEKLMKNFEGVELRGRKVRLELTSPHKEKYSEKKKERFYSSKGKSGGYEGGNRDRGSRDRDSGKRKRY